MSSKKGSFPFACRQVHSPRSYWSTKANSHHAPLPIHVRLAYGYNDGYNLTRNSDLPRRRIRGYEMWNLAAG